MEKVIVILGPTAVGKTKLSIELAKLLHTEIISGDSMLLYRGLDIGAAKPSLAERQGIIHHFVDTLEPTAEFSAADFQEQASILLTKLNQTNKIPIITGGTGLYVKALLEGYQFNVLPGDEVLRRKFAELALAHGKPYLHNLLKQRAPLIAAKLHPNDIRRVIRALEIHELSGDIAEPTKTGNNSLLYDALVIGLTMDRAKLYERINQRVEQMLAQGLKAEVANLLAKGMTRKCQAMQGIGYKEIASYLAGESEWEAAVTQIKKATRNFAKRQFTWYRQMPYIKWFEPAAYATDADLLAVIYRHVAEKFDLE